MKNIYIPPILVQSSTLKGINEYNEDKDGFLYSMLTKYKKSNSDYSVINFDELFVENPKAIVLGEPGCGKSELICQIKNQSSERSKNIIDFSLTNYTENAVHEFMNDDKEDSVDNIFCFDALDEVDSNLFPNAVLFISSVCEKYPKSSIIVTCRSYYIENNLSLIGLLSKFKFILVDLFDEDRIRQYITHIFKDSKLKEFFLKKINGGDDSSRLLSLLKIPRYLTEICKVINNNKYKLKDIEEWKRSDFFEKAIYFKLQNDIKKKKKKVYQMN